MKLDDTYSPEDSLDDSFDGSLDDVRSSCDEEVEETSEEELLCDAMLGEDVLEQAETSARLVKIDNVNGRRLVMSLL